MIMTGKLKDSEKNLSQCYFVHNTSHMDYLCGEKSGKFPPKPRHEVMLAEYFDVRLETFTAMWMKIKVFFVVTLSDKEVIVIQKAHSAFF
jgi:hypothetical protein